MPDRRSGRDTRSWWVSFLEVSTLAHTHAPNVSPHRLVAFLVTRPGHAEDEVVYFDTALSERVVKERLLEWEGYQSGIRVARLRPKPASEWWRKFSTGDRR